jgi:hypothetical protein
MPGALEFVFQKTVIETRIVRDENPAGQARMNIVGQLGKGRRVFHHGIRDAGQRLDEFGNVRLRIDQAAPFLHAIIVD